MNPHGYGPSGVKQTHYVTWGLHLSEPHLGNDDVGGELEHHGKGWIAVLSSHF